MTMEPGLDAAVRRGCNVTNITADKHDVNDVDVPCHAYAPVMT